MFEAIVILTKQNPNTIITPNTFFKMLCLIKNKLTLHVSPIYIWQQANISITEANRSILQMKATCLYCDNYTQNINTLCGLTAVFGNHDAVGKCGNHCELRQRIHGLRFLATVYDKEFGLCAKETGHKCCSFGR
jgi:hypothetical protein